MDGKCCLDLLKLDSEHILKSLQLVNVTGCSIINMHPWRKIFQTIQYFGNILITIL